MESFTVLTVDGPSPQVSQPAGSQATTTITTGAGGDPEDGAMSMSPGTLISIIDVEILAADPALEDPVLADPALKDLVIADPAPVNPDPV